MEMSNKSSSNKDNVEAMYQHQEMKGRHGYEYVVRGAEAFCGHGRTTCVLNLPVDHGVYTSDGRPLITVSDSKLENISGFKTCTAGKKESPCHPELGQWSVASQLDMKIKDPSMKEAEYAVEKIATADCAKGGIVAFNTSGQTSPSYNSAKVKGAIEILEDKRAIWQYTDYGREFLGHVKVSNAGMYNFGINFFNNKNVKKPGSVFVYEYSWGKLRFIGSYEIKDHTNNEQEKFPKYMIKVKDKKPGHTVGICDYWKYWADIALNSSVLTY